MAAEYPHQLLAVAIARAAMSVVGSAAAAELVQPKRLIVDASLPKAQAEARVLDAPSREEQSAPAATARQIRN